MTGAEGATRIYQTKLDQIFAALRDDDFDAYQDHFLYPHPVETFDSATILHGPGDMRRIFDAQRADIEMGLLMDMVRQCLAADFKDDATIKGSHETRLISRSLEIQQTYPVLSILRRSGDTWRVASSQNAISTDSTIGRWVFDRARG